MRALVIDDSRAMRRIVSGILEGFGYETQQAGHGREGLDVLDKIESTPVSGESPTTRIDLVKVKIAG